VPHPRFICTMTSVLLSAALLLAATTNFQPALATLLLRHGQAREDPGEEDPVKKIHEKWDKMDDFVEIMFTIACKWKHGNDVNGLAASKLKSGKLKSGGVTAFKAKTQARNVQHLKAACGTIVASGKKKCRQGCADRWGVAMGKRNECDGKCVKVYDHFESECLIKADNLEKVYAMKLDRSAARKQCHEGNCPNIPTTWMMTKNEDMTAEVEKQCKSQCDEKGIKAQCERAWVAQVDFVLPSIASTCFAKSRLWPVMKRRRRLRRKRRPNAPVMARKSVLLSTRPATKKERLMQPSRMPRPSVTAGRRCVRNR